MMKKLMMTSWLVLCSLLLVTQIAHAAPQKRLISYWSSHQASSKTRVNHSAWQKILNKYVVSVSGVNRFKYKSVSSADKKALAAYLKKLQSTDPRKLNRGEQFAYWVNLYNAQTVQLVLQNYPVSSIKKIGHVIKGPWDKKLMKVNGRSLSLNQIEHGILRPIYNDPRIHYVVNCASIGCPNLPKTALTGSNYKSQLSRAARAFVNHSRAVKFTGNNLRLSSIYKWYASDFGKNEKQLLKHLSLYASPKLKKKLQSFKGKISYDYNWSLNKL